LHWNGIKTLKTGVKKWVLNEVKKVEFVELLKKAAEENKSIVCMGIDPVLERIPIKGKPVEDSLVEFYSQIIDAAKSENALPGAFKPNYAFFAQYGFPGLRALKKIISLIKETSVPLILDVKRADIGKTSKAYGKEIFEFWEADCATIQPYMGFDSVQPFIEWSELKGKGLYFLNRTSNKGAMDFQNLKTETGNSLYLEVSAKLVEWGANSNGNVGAVVGATSLQELESICSFFVKNSSLPVPLLIPGVGAQGGSALEVVEVLKKTGMPLELQRINSSSGINYAYEEEHSVDFAGAAVKAIKKLNAEIGFK